MYFNTHTHLNSHSQYERIEELLERCEAHQVDRMVVVGYNLESSKKAIAIAHTYDNIYATVGISPNDCDEATEDDLMRIKELISDEKVVAVGEIGLDYYYDNPKEKQRRFFATQLAYAEAYDKPVVIHCRDAYEETYQMLSASSVKGIMHCYSGSYQMALRFVKLGYMISLAGPVTFKNAKVPKEVATHVPLESLLIETDDPYLTPVPFRGKPNEPAHVIYIAQQIAELKGLDVDEVAKVTYENALRIFRLKTQSS